jgi:hypothetical protein
MTGQPEPGDRRIDLAAAVRGHQVATAAVTRLRHLAADRAGYTATGDELMAVTCADLMTDVIRGLDRDGLCGVALLIAVEPELAAELPGRADL